MIRNTSKERLDGISVFGSLMFPNELQLMWNWSTFFCCELSFQVPHSAHTNSELHAPLLNILSRPSRLNCLSLFRVLKHRKASKASVQHLPSPLLNVRVAPLPRASLTFFSLEKSLKQLVELLMITMLVILNSTITAPEVTFGVQTASIHFEWVLFRN